ncbi:fungal-specific transcription factor domain-containing protein [Microdochium trichocladiopsis]|uniref:Fungal-specific transcription factor domain-containing protein n=1 Tax=Microdochium trichocladiopsis TaxID=1682393 RepID=A0A9P8YH54_9PEZI|nr:fungal-specific transcription factor domain-containing protein [Microdochium trichocladiopsis]KAH7039907.1 fungal-specific transcription factor domain-containing protein [Microdochium trichocladiopsis]
MASPQKPRRLLAACHPCHKHKTRCSGDQPCQACVSSGRAMECEYPRKERKVPISEAYLRRLEADSKRFREYASAQKNLQSSATQLPTPDPAQQAGGSGNTDDELPLSHEESNMLNPLFDPQGREPADRRALSAVDSDFIGEASCSAFSDRLLQCFDDTYTPAKAGFSSFLRLDPPNHAPSNESFPERMHAKLLLNVARRFIGNYHPLFLEVTFMKEMDAVYRREINPPSLWLCKFYALMALGEIYSNRRGVDNNGLVPGARYYERAVDMFQDKDIYEEPLLIHVEILTLLRLTLITKGWASNIFGRVRTAYHYSGVAMRLAMSMGMHRAATSSSTLTPVERESRRRAWWVLYFFDRFSASKLGQPVSVRDEDIDVEMPSMDGLTEEERAEFLDPEPLVINTKLGRIIGNILTDVYGVPNSRRGLCIRGVHRILKQLRSWYDELPRDLRLKERGTPRPVASLHLAYNQCIIQTTRPVLLHLFKSQFQLGKSGRDQQREAAAEQQQPPALRQQSKFSPITLALAESCVNAARSSSRIVEGLFLDGAIASYGYWDAHHISSAALILVISAVMKPAAVTSEALETLLSILRSIKKDGNIPAVDFCDRLSQVQARVFSLRCKIQGQAGHEHDLHSPRRQQEQQDQPSTPHVEGINRQKSGQMLADHMAAATSLSSLSSASFANTPPQDRPQSDHAQNLGGTNGDRSHNNGSTPLDWFSTANNVLADPLIGSFLNEAPQMVWTGPEGNDIFFTDNSGGGVLGPFASETGTHFPF